MVGSEPEHLAGYQARDNEVIDYQLYQLPGTELYFRGPESNLPEHDFVSCLGAAQTFGCFTEQPYPALIGQQLEAEVLNLGYGGAGPRFYNRHPELIDLVNRGKLAVVQVMSGRSEDNSRFESGGLELLKRRSDGQTMSADAAWRSVLELRYAWKRVPLGKRAARRLCRSIGSAQAKRLLEETRANWIESYCQLLDSIEVPTILFWFSKRSPDFQEAYEDLHKFMGIYPQLVTREMVDSIANHADHYIECTSQRGSPQKLISRFHGGPVEIDLGRDRDDFAGQTWRENRYYPSPEMHQDASKCLLETLPGLLRP
jgi:hypothetical protein